MKCEIVGVDSRYRGVVRVRVPGIYGTKGNPLPARMSRLVRPAARALKRVYRDVVKQGGHLYLSDMFRSFAEQQRAHEDWKSGRKSAYSPPACNSVHESARAIDIDAFDTGIGHRRVRAILNRHGWVHIVPTLTGPECWHYEFRGRRFDRVKRKRGYAAMAQAMKEAIDNVRDAPRAEKAKEEVHWLQRALNRLLGTRLRTDGIYGRRTREAVRRAQAELGLQVDGVAGPITRRALREALGEGP